MTNTNETIADIIAEMRKISAEKYRLSSENGGAYGDPGVYYLDFAQFARVISDRLEAAHKRELSKNVSKNEANFGQLGDAAKLREALVQAELFVGNIVRHGHQTLVPGDKCTACDGAEELRDMICAALAEPVRNCDVGTAEEQEVRFRNYCWNHSSRDKNMECQCPIDTEGKAGCKLTWAQMPYEEGGAK